MHHKVYHGWRELYHADFSLARYALEKINETCRPFDIEDITAFLDKLSEYEKIECICNASRSLVEPIFEFIVPDDKLYLFLELKYSNYAK